MRRIAAVAITTGALVVGMGTVSTSPDAAVKPTGSWATTSKGKVFEYIKIKGTYTKTKKTVRVYGTIQDGKKDGWSPAVQFRSQWKKGSKWHESKVISLTYGGTQADFKFSHYFGKFWTTHYVGHLQVREVGIRTSDLKQKPAGWKKIY